MYDLIVIGGGPGGGEGAEKAARSGLSTLLIEEKFLGGVCLNEGCIPSKTLLNSAKVYSHARHGEIFGVGVRDVTFNMPEVIARKNKVVQSLRKGSESTKKKLGVPVVNGRGTILGKKGELFQVQVGSEVYEAKRLLIATGSEAIRPPLPGVNNPIVCTNREILDVQAVPSKFVVVGGGIIGLEIANFFAEVGSQVTVIELLPAIAGPLDNDIRVILQKELEKKGITFKLNTKVLEIGDKKVIYQSAGDSGTQSIDADLVLLSVGRRPLTKNIGLENVNVLVERGAIVTDEHGRTNIPGIWAAGDVNGKSMLAHTASREAFVCVKDMLGLHDRIRYETIPSVIYTHPEVGSVGYKEDEAKEKGYDVLTASIPFTYSGRFWAETEPGEKSLCKVVFDKKRGIVLGVHMVGPYSSEIIAAAVPMIEYQMPVHEIEELVFPHPTVGEILKETIIHGAAEIVAHKQKIALES